MRVVEQLVQDARYAMRSMRRAPGFTAVAVLTLALGTGANTAIFSVLYGVWLSPAKYAHADRLVDLSMQQLSGRRFTGGTSYANLADWKAQTTAIEAFGAHRYAHQVNVTGSEGAEEVAGHGVSANLFGLLGASPAVGHPMESGADRSGGPRQALIGYTWWQRRFGGDAAVVGRQIQVDDEAFTVVGVMPRGFEFPPMGSAAFRPVIWTSLNLPVEQERARDSHSLDVVARLKAGSSIRQAQAELDTIVARLASAYPAEDGGWGIKVTQLTEGRALEAVRPALLLVMAAAALVLLIACANIANLLLSRAAARQRELSVRMAIGASRLRIVRQLMTESLLLALLGAVGGFLLAIWGSRLLVGLLSTSGNVLDIGVSPDLRLLAFTMAVAVLTALLFGLAPAIRATRGGLNRALKENERGAAKGSTRLHFGKALVSGQVALSFVLLLGAGLFLGTLRNFLSIDPGFSRHNVLLVSATLPNASQPAERTRMYREILDRLQGMPGVVSAASSVLTPIQPAGWANMIQPQGFISKSRGDSLLFLNRVSADYFQTMRTPVRMGRAFDSRDDLTAPPAMVINESAAHHFFGAANPLGKTIGMTTRGGSDLYQVIGVVKDTKYNRLNEEQRNIGFLAAAQDSTPQPSLNYSLRSDGPVEALIPSVRAAFSGVNRDIALEFRNLETQVNESLLRPRMVALLSTVFGSLALLLAMVGLYGITNYAVAQRKGEIGIRLALGAQPRSVIWLMLRDTAVLVVAGVAVGLAASLAAGRLVASLLYGVKFNDPVELAGAALTLAAAIALAAYLPARRAAQGDPMAALRQE